MSSVLPTRPAGTMALNSTRTLVGSGHRGVVLLGTGKATRADVVDGHPMRRQPPGQIVGDAMDGVLGREIRRDVPVEGFVQGRVSSLPTVDRGDIDDPTPAAGHHRRGEQLAESEGSIDVDGEDGPPIVERHVGPMLVWRDADVVHKDVDPTGLLAQRQDVRFARDVSRDGGSFTAEFADEPGRLVELGSATSDEDNASACLGEPERDHLAEACPRTGHESAAPFQRERREGSPSRSFVAHCRVSPLADRANSDGILASKRRFT